MVEKHDMQLAFIVLLFSLKKKTCFYVITENREESKDNSMTGIWIFLNRTESAVHESLHPTLNFYKSGHDGYMLVTRKNPWNFFIDSRIG